MKDLSFDVLPGVKDDPLAAQRAEHKLDPLKGNRPVKIGFNGETVVWSPNGANAAVIAASRDPHIKATVLVDALSDPETILREHIGPTRRGLRWMQPLTKWTFELSYGVDAEAPEPRLA